MVVAEAEALLSILISHHTPPQILATDHHIRTTVIATEAVEAVARLHTATLTDQAIEIPMLLEIETEIAVTGIEIDQPIAILMRREIRDRPRETLIAIEIETAAGTGIRGGRGVGVRNGMMLGESGCRIERGIFTGGSKRAHG